MILLCMKIRHLIIKFDPQQSPKLPLTLQPSVVIMLPLSAREGSLKAATFLITPGKCIVISC